MIGGTAQQHTLAVPYDLPELLELLSTSVLVLDWDLQVLYANNATQDLLGFGNNQVCGRTLASLFVGDTALHQLLLHARERQEACARHELTLTTLGDLRGPRSAAGGDATRPPFGSAPLRGR